MALTSVNGSPVIATCNSLSSFKARIEQVTMAFTVEEIVTELAPDGVVSAQKFPYKRPGHNSSHTGKVLLVFDRPPPPSVFLGYKAHPVIMEAAKPLTCFNCQRLGHHSSRCSLPRACRRCGEHNHLAAACPNAARCVNCKGSHAAGSNACPRVAFHAERNRLLMEARLLQQVRASAPTAFIAAEVQNPPDHSNTTASDTIRTPPPAPTRTFATVVRSITVAEDGGTAPAVLLPKERPIPRKRRSVRPSRRPTRFTRQRPPKKRKTAASRKKTTVDEFGSLSVVADLLQAFNPKAAEAVRILMTHLKPLLSLVKVLQKGESSVTKHLNARTRS